LTPASWLRTAAASCTQSTALRAHIRTLGHRMLLNRLKTPPKTRFQRTKVYKLRSRLLPHPLSRTERMVAGRCRPGSVRSDAKSRFWQTKVYRFHSSTLPHCPDRHPPSPPKNSVRTEPWNGETLVPMAFIKATRQPPAPSRHSLPLTSRRSASPCP